MVLTEVGLFLEYDYCNYGPTFGPTFGSDILIKSGVCSQSFPTMFFDCTYKGNVTLTPHTHFTVEDYEVYQVISK